MTTFKVALRYIASRFREPSSLAGIGAVVLAVGVSEPAWSAVAGAITGLCGLIAFFLPEGK